MTELHAPLTGEARHLTMSVERPPLPLTGEAAPESIAGAYIMPAEAVKQLSAQVAQLGRIVSVLARRMEDMEAQSARLITVSHAQALQLGKLIRGKAQAVAQRYGLPADSEKKIRAAIKKELLARIGVKDLHDTPLAAWDRAAGIIDGWSNIALVMELRRRNG